MRIPTGLLVFVFFLGIYTFTASGWIDSSDGQLMYRVTQSIVEEHSVAVPERFLGLAGVDGQKYSPTGLGISLLIVPFYVAGKAAVVLLPDTLARAQFTSNSYPAEFAAQMLNPVAVALTCALLFQFGISLGWRTATSLIVAVTYGLGTVAWPDSKHFFAHQSATFFLLLAAYLICRHRQSGSVRSAWGAGLSAGAAVLTYVSTGLALPALAAYFVLGHWSSFRSGERLRAAGPLAAFAGGVSLALAASALYNLVRFGTPLETGYAASGNQVYLETPILYGLYGILFSSGKSVFLYSPPLVLAAFAFRGFWARHRDEAILALVLASSYILYFARLNVWHGDWSWGPRYQAPWLPLVTLSLGPFIDGALGRRGLARIAAIASFALVGVGVQTLGVVVAYESYLARVPNAVGTTVYQYMSEAHFLPNYSPLVGHLRLARTYWTDAVTRLRQATAKEGVLYGEGWMPVETMGDLPFRRSAGQASLTLITDSTRDHILNLTMNDNYRPADKPAVVSFRVDGPEAGKVLLDEVTFGTTADEVVLPNRAWTPVSILVPGRTAGRLADRVDLHVVTSVWNAPETGGRDFGVAISAIAIDGQPLPLDGRISWRDTGFRGKNGLVHRSFDIWWVKVLYADIPIFVLAVPLASLIVVAVSGGMLLKRCGGAAERRAAMAAGASAEPSY